MMLCVIGENIEAGSSVIVSRKDGKFYTAGEHAGTIVGEAVENLREGFRGRVDAGRVREDDA